MSKILHLIGYFREDSGGAQRVILDIINNCDHPDLQMGLCSLFGEPTLSKELPDDVYNVNFNYSFKYNPKIFWDLYRLVSEWEPDMLHVHSPAVAIYGRPVAKICGIKLISTVHNDVRKISLRNKMLDKLTIGFSDSIVCVSDLAEESARDEYNSYMFTDDIRTIWNCLDYRKFESKVNNGRVEKKIELGFEDGSFLVGTVGSLVPQKGQKYLIKAWKKVSNEFPNAKLVLVGDGKEKAHLQELASTCSVADSVHFLGSRNDVPDILNMLDLFVFPSLHEGLGLALLEAMCMEKVIIASDINPLRQVLGDTGLLVSPADAESLAEKIIDVLNNFEEKKYLGKQAKKRVKDKFAPDEFGKQWSAVYNQYV